MKDDWIPEESDPALPAGFRYVEYVEADMPRVVGFHYGGFVWHSCRVRQAFWEGVKWQRNREVAEGKSKEAKEKK